MSHKNQRNPVRIALIGLGPRGLAIIEQICRQVFVWPVQSFELLLFDPVSFGEGCHQQHQPKYFLMNTAAEQLGWSAIRSDKHQSFGQWIRENMISTPELTSSASNTSGSSSKTNSISHGYYPRSLFGRYLRESLEQLLKHAPKDICWQWIQQEVIGIKKNADGSWNLETSEDLIENVDYVHLCTGHGPSERPKSPPKKGTAPSSLTIDFTYPFDDYFSSLTPSQTVALEGMGLTAFDVVADLTEGRGGEFIPKGDKGLLEYLPSGKEPKIIAYSRTGLPLKAKPKGQDQVHEKMVYRHLTDRVVRTLQSKGSLDFKVQILPLVNLELKQSYYDTYFQLHPELLNDLPTDFDGSLGPKALLAKMESLVPQQDRFSLDAVLDPFSSFDMRSEVTFRRSMERYLREDFLSAELGVAGSPEKAAMNTLRDIREQIAKLIDVKMLSGDSQRWLYETFLPKIKWLSVGPPRSRIAQWLALSEADVLTLNFGGAPECASVVDDTAQPSGWTIRSKIWPGYMRRADILIRARIQVSEEVGNQPLVRSLLDQGLATIFDNGGCRPGGLEVSHDFQVMRRDGKPAGNLWATGILTEGQRFYTFSLPSPGKASRFDTDAKTAVQSMFSSLEDRTREGYEDPYDEKVGKPHTL
jgi:uncharacterized NAD(P)/FAD-binding protein YdhS